MRFFLGFAAASTIGGAVAAGCGSSSSPSTPVDSGTGDVTTEAMPQPEAAVETGPDVIVEAGPDVCVPDASLSSIQVPDAALNEAGATVAGCFACFNQYCPMLVAECNASCACIADFQQFATCLGAGGSTLTCLSSLGNLGSVGVDASVFACGLPCLGPCGQSLPTPDGGHDGGGEGGEAGGD
jgi:hypothetical protein